MTNKYDEEFLPTQPGWDLPSQQKLEQPQLVAQPVSSTSAQPVGPTTPLDLRSIGAAPSEDSGARPLSEYAKSAVEQRATQPSGMQTPAPVSPLPVTLSSTNSAYVIGNAATSNAPTARMHPEQFSFTGSGSEYFRIWIVNLFLILLTMGLYSAWAKVRKTKYFYNNTRVAGQSFEYHGDPVSILKGRIIATGIFSLYLLAGKTSPVLGGVAGLILAAIMPWMIWKSLQFKLYNTSHRSLRFGFVGQAKGSYFVFAALPIVLAMTVGASLLLSSALAKSSGASPVIGTILLVLIAVIIIACVAMWHLQLKAYQLDNTRYGVTTFSLDATLFDFFKAYAIVAIIFSVVTGVLVFAVFGSSFKSILTLLMLMGPAAAGVLAAILILGFVSMQFLVLPVLRAMIHNVVWNNTQLGKHRFTSQVSIPIAAWVALSNTAAIICTFGLFIPFAQVRTARLHVGALTLHPATDLDAFAADQQRQAAAMGEGMADLLDLNVGM